MSYTKLDITFPTLLPLLILLIVIRELMTDIVTYFNRCM